MGHPNQIAAARAALTTHGESPSQSLGRKATPEYTAWQNMHARCEIESSSRFKRYGGRGIQVCARWSGRTGFQNFLTDMGRKPSPKHTLERNNTNGNYTSRNCRWATQKEQANNRTTNRRISFRGECLTISDWARRIGIQPCSLCERLAVGWSIERALTTPSRFAQRTE